MHTSKIRFTDYIYHLITFALLLLFTVNFYDLTHNSVSGIDDANIFMVYAKNFAQGYGFAYNQGAEQVEGFTSLLWVLLSAIGYAVMDSGNFFMLIMTITFTTLTLFLVIQQVKEDSVIHFGKSHIPQIIIFIFLVAALYSDRRFLLWAIPTLMDNALWCFVLISGAFLVISCRDNKHLNKYVSAYIPIALISRPEAMIYVPAMIALYSFLEYGAQRKFPLKRITSWMAVFSFSLIILIVFRLVVFGHPLPNTYYAKVSSGFISNLMDGFGYLTAYMRSSLFSLLILLNSILLAIFSVYKISKKEMKEIPSSFYFSFPALLVIAFPVLNGGDHFVYFRFFQNAFPILLIPMAGTIIWGMNKLRHPRKLYPSAFLGFCGLTCLSLIFTFKKISADQYSLFFFLNEYKIAQAGYKCGYFLDDFFQACDSPTPTVGVITAGGFKLGYSGFVYDLLGLNYPEMAHADRSERNLKKNHAAFNKKVFQKAEPVILIPAIKAKAEIEGYLKVMNYLLKGYLDDEAFRTEYDLYTINVSKDSPEIVLICYIRKDMASSVLDCFTNTTSAQ